jgi:hypothetical protein
VLDRKSYIDWLLKSLCWVCYVKAEFALQT